MPVVGFGVVAGIGHDDIETNLLEGSFQQRNEAIDIDARATADQNAQQQVAGAVEGTLELSVATVADRLPFFADAGAATHIVQAPWTALQAGGVECDTMHALAPLQKAAHRITEQTLGQGDTQQAAASLLQSCKVRHPGQAQYSAEIAKFRE
ncbi:MAG TPA: hypothetical protein VGY66_09305 [Gemmataceae bacterium]|nr:hypothetical protein [Gemmataceae bacterium]